DPEPKCRMVEYDPLEDDLFEESLGSMYDFDDNGELQIDEDASGVSIQMGPTPSIDLGTSHFSTSDGDVIELLKEKPQFNDDTEFQSYKLVPKNWGTTFKIRIFTGSGVGVLLAQKDGMKEWQCMGVMDCRAEAQP